MGKDVDLQGQFLSSYSPLVTRKAPVLPLLFQEPLSHLLHQAKTFYPS